MPPTVTIRMREPDNEECSEDQRKHLAIAFPLAEMMIRNAMGEISEMEKGSIEEDVFIRHFGKDAFSHRWHIKSTYSDILRQWKGGPTYPYVCRKQGEGRCAIRQPPMLLLILWE